MKRKALERLASGEKASAIAKSLKVHQSMIYQWRKRLNGASKDESAKPTTNGSNTRDAIVYLRHAKVAMTEELRSGKSKNLSKSNLYALLALESLVS
jgi:transposase-like protein